MVCSYRLKDIFEVKTSREALHSLGRERAVTQEIIYRANREVKIPRGLYLLLGIPIPITYLALYAKTNKQISHIWLKVPSSQGSIEALDTTVAHVREHNMSAINSAAGELASIFKEQVDIWEPWDIHILARTGFRDSDRFGPRGMFELFLVTSLAAEAKDPVSFKKPVDRRYMFHTVIPGEVVTRLENRQSKKGSALVLAHFLLEKVLVEGDKKALDSPLKEYRNDKAMGAFSCGPGDCRKVSAIQQRHERRRGLRVAGKLHLFCLLASKSYCLFSSPGLIETINTHEISVYYPRANVRSKLALI